MFLEALKRHRTPGRGADEALKLISLMGWDLGVGMQRKPVDTDTAGARARGVFAFITKQLFDQLNLHHGYIGQVIKSSYDRL